MTVRFVDTLNTGIAFHLVAVPVVVVVVVLVVVVVEAGSHQIA